MTLATMAAYERDGEARRTAQVSHYLQTGESDPLHSDWPGGKPGLSPSGSRGSE